ncbi:MAG: Decarbamoylnovobiocin carbamoyltransferase [bacterium ADurb.Bin236]|nr:MAG: Decarbamoylnovobiocin carbamoyltransferase [bacterium ADurb.Bin236]HOY62528.1 carbamoyltransferase [bacterium]HPN95100.1 carbamoyltransferase [bacterium]
MNILGISAYYHDSAACLVKDGEIFAAAQEERFTRKKHDPDFPHNSIDYCLNEAGLGSASELDCVVFYDKPFIKFERLLLTYLSYAPAGFRSFMTAMPTWLTQKLWLREEISKRLKFKGPLLFSEHHESHAASAFFPSPFEEAAVLTLDGVGEWATASQGEGRGNRVSISREIRFPHSLGLLYSAFADFCGFKVNSGEHKLMGLAPYGEPRFVDEIKNNLIDIKDDGSFRLNLKYFSYMAGLRMTNKRFAALFGVGPRKPESSITEIYMDLARSIQAVTEEIVLKMARDIRERTGMRNLCMAGGVALNCVANGALLREGVFDDIWIQPAAGDAGGAAGAAMLAWHHYYGKPRKTGKGDAQRGSLLGPEFTDEQIEAFLVENDILFERVGRENVAARTAELLEEGNVVGWFQGRMEFGPRALGARSIIGDARSRDMHSVMNLKIKFRESFRPFAPSVLAERAADYFCIDRESPYMLLTVDARKETRRELSSEELSLKGLDKLRVARSSTPAITHVDYSARVQTVSKDVNPLYHEMIYEFDRRTGCGLIINTSFNVRGEPIVCSPEDAYRCFMRTQMDYLVMGGFVLDKKRQPEVEISEDWLKEFSPD